MLGSYLKRIERNQEETNKLLKDLIAETILQRSGYELIDTRRIG